MPTGRELDLELVDAAWEYSLYSTALVNLAIRMNNNEDTSSGAADVDEYATRLEDSLVRCGVDVVVPRSFSNVGEVMRCLRGQSLMKSISNKIVRAHTRRQENVFVFSGLLMGVVLGEASGVDEATSSGRRALPLAAKQIDVPESVLNECLKRRNIQPLREHLSGHKQAESVFLVHGHDESAIHQVARFIEKLGLRAVILRELPNDGHTIIEKFTKYSDVRFAVVLLTGDDRGGTANIPFAKQSRRARQNVLFELGFFIGKLGRDRVCSLFQSGVDIPSDYSGTLFIPLDDGGAWRSALARELKSAGIRIDLNGLT